VELQNLKTDARETANALARLDAQSARKTEYAELRDRVAHTEASGDIVKRLEAKVRIYIHICILHTYVLSQTIYIHTLTHIILIHNS